MGLFTQIVDTVASIFGTPQNSVTQTDTELANAIVALDKKQAEQITYVWIVIIIIGIVALIAFLRSGRP